MNSRPQTRWTCRQSLQKTLRMKVGEALRAKEALLVGETVRAKTPISFAALARYKASLLGQATLPAVLAADPETRRVVIHELRIIVAGRPDIVLPLDTPEKVLAVESHRLIVKEGLAFSTKLIFSVHHDVVLGLRFAQKVTRLGVTCDTINIMIGSCAYVLQLWYLWQSLQPLPCRHTRPRADPVSWHREWFSPQVKSRALLDLRYSPSCSPAPSRTNFRCPQGSGRAACSGVGPTVPRCAESRGAALFCFNPALSCGALGCRRRCPTTTAECTRSSRGRSKSNANGSSLCIWPALQFRY